MEVVVRSIESSGRVCWYGGRLVRGMERVYGDRMLRMAGPRIALSWVNKLCLDAWWRG